MKTNKLEFSAPPSKLKLRRPYYKGFKNIWEQTALPLGNGSLGLTVIGEVKSDKLVLNHKTLWVGGPSPKRPNYCGGNINKPDENGKMPYDYYYDIRKEFQEGNDKKAHELCEKLVGIMDGYGAYQCWGNLEFCFDDIKKYAGVIEDRLNDDWCTIESVLEDNAGVLKLAQEHKVNYILIDGRYEINIDL